MLNRGDACPTSRGGRDRAACSGALAIIFSKYINQANFFVFSLSKGKGGSFNRMAREI